MPDTEELVRKINNVTGRMELLLVNKIKVYREFLSGVSKKRVMPSPLNIIEDKRMAVVSLTQRLDSAGEIQFSKKKSEFAQLSAKLDMLNPLGVLLRGYAVADVEGKGVVNSVKNINKNDVLTVRLSDGSVKATVNEINEKRGSDNE